MRKHSIKISTLSKILLCVVLWSYRVLTLKEIGLITVWFGVLVASFHLTETVGRDETNGR